MPDLKNIQGLLRHISACNRHEPEHFLPVFLGNTEIGLIRRESMSLFSSLSGMGANPDRVVIENSAALDKAEKLLQESSRINFRDEPFSILTEWGSPELGRLDRGAIAFFGIRAYGVHVNGVVIRPDGLYLWIAKRSAHLKISPGKLDHIIGGGSSAGMSAMETLIKEAEEEAGLSETIARTAQPVSVVSYTMDVPEGVKRDTLFIYDLFMPEDTIPDNKDGEVAAFTLMPVEKVADLVANTDDFKWNCNLVVIDFLIRHGYISAEDSGYEQLAKGLRQ